jgi:predicted GIY-YIG superfamily endonuclease
MRSRDHYRYELRRGGKIIYIGITNNPDRRKSEHRSKGKYFASMTILGSAVTRESAQRWERKRLDQYAKNHRGSLPEYNDE